MFSHLSILYVEDEDLIRQNAVEYLGRLCAKVIEARDGYEAFQIYTDQKPDIIITDIKMPRLNGLELAKKIRRLDKTTPVIIATAHTETTYLLQAVELQLIKYIVKPVTAAKLKEALTMAMDSHSVLMIDPDTRYDTFNKSLLIGDEHIKLTKNENLLLDLLVKNHQRAVTYKEIENLIWVESSMSMDALRSLVRVVRKKMRGDFIENISGIGYRLRIN